MPIWPGRNGDKAIPVLTEVTGDLLYATPHYPLANLGWAYYNKKVYDKAQYYLEEALDLKPDFFIAQLNLGRTFLATGRLHDALALFEKAAEVNPKNPVLLLATGPRPTACWATTTAQDWP